MKDDAQAYDFVRGSIALRPTPVVCTILTLPIVLLLYVLLVHSSTDLGHRIVHATPLVGTMLAIIGWWMRTLAVTPTVEEEETPS